MGRRNHPNADKAIDLALEFQAEKRARSIAYIGNIVNLWERMVERNIHVDLGSDQTSLHNPWAGGYYPLGLSYEESNEMMAHNPQEFKTRIQQTLKRHVKAVNALVENGMYFFDYGNAFLLESSRAGAEIMAEDGEHFRYPSYVQDIMGPMCFDYGFGPFRWVCATNPKDLDTTDAIAEKVLEELKKNAPEEIQQQMDDNIRWIKGAKKNELVVGSHARILYANSEGRIEIARAFNKAIAAGKIGPIILGRDHHDVSGTDSPTVKLPTYMTAQALLPIWPFKMLLEIVSEGLLGLVFITVVASGWGEVINGGFGMLLDGSDAAERNWKTSLI